MTNCPTKEQLKDHYWAGMGNLGCLVCGSPSLGSFTDYNGQVRCYGCGCTYQVMGNHLTDKYLKEIGLSKEQVADCYCDCFSLIPILRDYFEETGQKVPFGCYLMDPKRIPFEERDNFYRWLAYNASKYKDEFKNELDWEGLERHYKVYANSGDGI